MIVMTDGWMGMTLTVMIAFFASLDSSFAWILLLVSRYSTSVHNSPTSHGTAVPRP